MLGTGIRWQPCNNILLTRNNYIVPHGDEEDSIRFCLLHLASHWNDSQWGPREPVCRVGCSCGESWTWSHRYGSGRVTRRCEVSRDSAGQSSWRTFSHKRRIPPPWPQHRPSCEYWGNCCSWNISHRCRKETCYWAGESACVGLDTIFSFSQTASHTLGRWGKVCSSPVACGSHHCLGVSSNWIRS